MKWVVDTNVPKTANGRTATPQASAACVQRCVQRLLELQRHHVLVLDDQWLILAEYCRQLRSTGQPGVGDAFLKWVLTHQTNSRHCQRVSITPLSAAQGRRYLEFPDDENLAGFDPADQMFVAVALADPDHPPVLNAVDSDWLIYQDALAGYGVPVETLCPETIKANRIV